MIIQLYFEQTDKEIPFNNQHQMNGFIYSLLGDSAKKYHDAFSNYSVSSIQGGHMSTSKQGLKFDREPFIQISSNNNSVINDFANGILGAIDNRSANFFGLYPTRMEGPFDFSCKKYFDVVRTMSPILIKKDGKKLNCTDEAWVDALTENCVKKLAHEGIFDPTFKIEVKKKEALHTKMIMVGDVFNPCTEGVFTVYGTPKTRKCLYNLGLGNSTGTGFGAIRLL